MLKDHQRRLQRIVMVGRAWGYGQNANTFVRTTLMIENKKKPNPIDIHVGSRIRLRRTMLGMSQEKLGESLGITFQQIQKYEKGTNRVGASRLQNISNILTVPVSFFFEDAPGENSSNSTGMAEASSSNYVVDFLSSSEGLQLNRAFVKIADPKVRRKIVDLVKALGAEADAE
jgi:transcriptional regulator with XRE-family HTH domain